MALRRQQVVLHSCWNARLVLTPTDLARLALTPTDLARLPLTPKYLVRLAALALKFLAPSNNF